MSEIITQEGNNLFPVFLKLEKLRVLIIGGGAIGFEKIQALLNSNPHTHVTLVAERILPELNAFAQNFPNTKLIRKSFDASDLKDRDVVIAAVNDRALSAEITVLANERGILINVADTPDLCDFYLGSIVKKGNLKIAISTNGKSPTIAKRLKEVFAEGLPDELDEVLDNMHIIRNQLKGDFANKISTLNMITKELALKKETKRKRVKVDWPMIASLAFFVLYFITMSFQLLPHQWISSLREVLDHAKNNFHWVFIGSPFTHLLNSAINIYTDLSCISNIVFICCLRA